MEENIKQNIPPTIPVVNVQVPPSPKPPFGNWRKLGFLVIGILLAASILYASVKYSQKQSPSVVYPTVTPTPFPTPPPVTQITLSPTPDARREPTGSAETANWKTFISPKGYQIRYPTQLLLEKRVEGFYVLLEDSQNPLSVAFYLDERGEKTLVERRKIAAENLVDVTFSELKLPGINGFIVSGTTSSSVVVRPGAYVKSAYLDFKGKELVFGCDSKFCRSELFDQILSTFRFD